MGEARRARAPATARRIEVVLAFDGSYNRDSTALAGCTRDRRQVFVVAAWERPERGDEHWTVPRSEVDAAVDKAMKRWRVLELACDPPGWHQEIEAWGERYSEVVVEFPTNRTSLMSEACSEFYSAVVNGEVRHDGDPRLARHLANAVVKETRDGAYITKDGRNSPRKIDLALAAVIAYHRAARAEERSRPSITLLF